MLFTVYFDKRNKGLERENIRPHRKYLMLVFSNCIGALPVYHRFYTGENDSYSQVYNI